MRGIERERENNSAYQSATSTHTGDQTYGKTIIANQMTKLHTVNRKRTDDEQISPC